MQHERMSIVLLVAAFFACGGSPTAPPTTVAPASADVTGRVVDITSGGGVHSVPDSNVVVELTNKSTRACTVDGVALSWTMGGHAEKTGLHLTLAAGTSTRITQTVNGDATMGMKLDNTVVTATNVACP
jgi:hypothetical protein